MKPILIVDYGMANLRSVQKALEQVGASAEISGDPDRVGEAERVILPGVGAFRDAIARLRETGLVEPLLAHLKAGKPFFGICLGMQMLFAGEVVRFEPSPGLKIPHMGWNSLHVRQPAPALEGLDGQSVYFVHSYYPVPTDPRIIAAEADYPTPFTAAVWRDNIFATQFHPEKSQAVGLKMLRQFAGRA